MSRVTVNEKREVLFINPFLYTMEGKTFQREKIDDTIIITMCRGFCKLGWKATVIADCRYKPAQGLSDEYDIEVIYLDSYLKKIFAPTKFPVPKGLISYLKKNSDRYDLIITSEVFSMYSLFAAIACKDKIVVWHELAMHNHMWHGMASKIWYNLFGRTVFKKIPIAPRSERAQRFIGNYCRNVSDTIFDHGVDLEKFKIHTDEKKNVFLSVSQLIPRKRVDRIIDEFATFVRENIGYKLYICGDGSEKDSLIEQTHRLGIEDSVIFTGNLSHSQLMDIWPYARALMIYTMKDNSMLTISESIACGTPILCTSIPDSSYLIETYSTGIVKDDWGTEDIYKVINDNSYAENCNRYRNAVSSCTIAEKFIRCFAKKDAFE